MRVIIISLECRESDYFEGNELSDVYESPKNFVKMQILITKYGVGAYDFKFPISIMHL